MFSHLLYSKLSHTCSFYVPLRLNPELDVRRDRYSGIPNAEGGKLNKVIEKWVKMSFYRASRGVSMVKHKIRDWYLGRYMDHLVDSIVKLNQGRKNWYKL